MTKKDQGLDKRALQELRDEIMARGWKESADFIAWDIEFVADLFAAGMIPIGDVLNFRYSTQITIDTLMKLRDCSFEEEVRRLQEAVNAFNHAQESRRSHDTPHDETELWSLSEALNWRQHVDTTRTFCEDCCYSWRIHLKSFPTHQQPVALECVREIEKRIPLLRSGCLANLSKQWEAIEKCMILNGQLVGYAGDTSILPRFTEAIVHQQKKWAALLEALIDSKWLDSSDPRRYLTTVATTIYQRDIRPDVGGHDSQGVDHSAGPGGRVKNSDALRRLSTSHLTLEEIADRPDDALVERRFTERSVAELEKAAEEDPRLAKYVHAIVRKPKWKRQEIWKSLGVG